MHSKEVKEWRFHQVILWMEGPSQVALEHMGMTRQELSQRKNSEEEDDS